MCFDWFQFRMVQPPLSERASNRAKLPTDRPIDRLIGWPCFRFYLT